MFVGTRSNKACHDNFQFISNLYCRVTDERGARKRNREQRGAALLFFVAFFFFYLLNKRRGRISY